MTSILSWFSLAAIALLASVILFLLAVARKRMRLLYMALISFFLCFAFGGIAVMRFGVKAYHRVNLAFRPRSGMEAYKALFGAPGTDCVHILALRDQYIPRIDDAIWLSFTACPQETGRLLSQYAYSRKRVAAKNIEKETTPAGSDNWFKPAGSHDSVWVYSVEPEPGRRWITAYISDDSTTVLYIDALD